jgi:ribonucleoside-diphosphate reductase alpha chain
MDLKGDYNFNRLAQSNENSWQDIFNRFKKEMLKRGTRLSAEELDWLIDNVYALPNSPALLTAGSPYGFFASACSSYPMVDSMRGHPFSILNTEGIANDAAIAGIGVGFNASNLRSSKELVRGRKNITGGPVSFLRKMSGSLGEITQGTRKSACMGALSVHHPDIIDFIHCKTDTTKLTNFNMSILTTDNFMNAVLENGTYTISPIKEPEYQVEAVPIFHEACLQGWLTGEPAWLFVDNIKRDYFKPELLNANNILPNPCQPGFASVLTPNGIRTFDDIDEGDSVWTGVQWASVKRKWCTGVKPVYSVVTAEGEFIGTENHRVFEKGKRVEAKDALSIDVAVGKDVILSVCIPECVMDGAMLEYGGHNSVSGFSLHIPTQNNEFFDSQIAHLIKGKSSPSSVASYAVETSLCPEDLQKIQDRRIPDRLMKGGIDEICSLLRGIFSVAGGISTGYVYYRTASKHMASQVQLLLSSLGILSYMVPSAAPSEKHTGLQYHQLILYESSEKFMQWVGFIQKSRSKARLTKSRPQVLPNKIRSRTYIGDFKVFDIEVDAPEHSYWTGGLLVSNCSEALLSCSDKDDKEQWLELCVLASINLPRYVKLSKDDRRKVVALTVRLLNDIIDRQDYVSEYHKIGCAKNRKIGIGVAGLATILATTRTKYSSLDGRKIASDLMHEISEYATEESSNLGDVNGLGRYNSSLLSIAPTSTLSNIFAYFNEEGCSYGVEPYFSIEPYTVKNSFGEFKVVDKIVDYMGGSTDHIEVANDLSWRAHIDVVADILAAPGRGIIQSVSKTVNFSNNITLEEYKEAVIHSWKCGIKGISFYRDGSRAHQVINTKASTQHTSVIETQAPKRPQSLPCDIHHVTHQGCKWLILVGLLESRPFEIFAGLEENLIIPRRYKNGEIVKSGRGSGKHYDLHAGSDDDEIVVKDIPKVFDNKDWSTWTRQVSLCLRHGVPIQYLCEQIAKSEDFSSFLRVITRILKKYIQDDTTSGDKCDCGGKMVYVQGCCTCTQCGRSACS